MNFMLKHKHRAACVSTVFLACLLVNTPAVAAVGRTEAIADVGVSGEALYSIPIRVTPGIGRVTPELAISYSGPTERTILGVGFRLSGLSVVTPCRKTIAQDFNAAPILLQAGDRYCVDGARLRSVSGNYGESNTTYQAEINRTLRATSYNSTSGIPGWFKVEAGDGLTYEYGNTTDSKLLGGTGAGAPPQFWAVNKIYDRAGNYLVVHYDTDNTARRFRPDFIDYTAGPGGAAHYRVQFVYHGFNRDRLRRPEQHSRRYLCVFALGSRLQQ